MQRKTPSFIMNGSTNTSNLSADSVSVNVHTAFHGGWHIPLSASFHCCFYDCSNSLMMLREGYLYEEKVFITPGLKLGVGVREVPAHRGSGGEKPERSSLTPTRFQSVKERVWKQTHSCSIQTSPEHGAMI